MVDLAFCRHEDIDDRSFEANRCVDLVNQVLDGFASLSTSMHLCHAHFQRQHGSENSHEPILRVFRKVYVDTISMEDVTPAAGGMDSLAQFPDRVRIGFGCIDPCDRKIETPEEVVNRVESVMRYMDKSFIALYPDRGFVPSTHNPIDLNEAYQKLKAMCEAAQKLSEKQT